MKRYFVLLLLLCVGFTSCKKKQAASVADILQHYAAINKKLKEYTPKHVDDITSAGGGTITGYYRDDEVKKIVAEHFTDTCRTFTEYYFDDGMLIFILEQNYVYNMPVSFTEEKAIARGDSIWYDDKKTRLDISRYYFSSNNMIKWIGPDGKEVPEKSAAFINRQSLLWAETVVLIKELKEQ